jgi:xanthine dehydrogenase accessory factor
MYELHKLITFGKHKSAENLALVWATIVDTEGSSYRKKWTQMLLASDGSFEGALSGGCVEKEVQRQAQEVFQTGENKLFEYDGTFKLGCKGKIFILLERMLPERFNSLAAHIETYSSQRKVFHCGIVKTEDEITSTYFRFGENQISLSNPLSEKDQYSKDEMAVTPQRQLIIVGGEHDSFHLADVAHASGFKTMVIVNEHFPVAEHEANYTTMHETPGSLASIGVLDEYTAVVLMTHSLAKDLHYLSKIHTIPLQYLGILGPENRKETILADLMELPDTNWMDSENLSNIYGPIGLNIHAKTPEEISISILAEIIGVFNHSSEKQQTFSSTYQSKSLV